MNRLDSDKLKQTLGVEIYLRIPIPELSTRERPVEGLISSPTGTARAATATTATNEGKNQIIFNVLTRIVNPGACEEKRKFDGWVAKLEM